MKTVQSRFENLCTFADKVSKEVKVSLPHLEWVLDFKAAPLVAQLNFQKLSKATQLDHFLMCEIEAINVLALELEPMFWDMKRLADMEATVKHEASQRSMRIAYDNNPSINFNTLK